MNEIIARRTRVDALRKTYGEDLGRKFAGDAKLETLLERTGYGSLTALTFVIEDFQPA